MSIYRQYKDISETAANVLFSQFSQAAFYSLC